MIQFNTVIVLEHIIKLFYECVGFPNNVLPIIYKHLYEDGDSQTGQK